MKGERLIVTLQGRHGPNTLIFEAQDNEPLPPVDRLQRWYDRYGHPTGGGCHLPIDNITRNASGVIARYAYLKIVG